MSLKNSPELTGEKCYNEVMTWDNGYHELSVYELQKLYVGEKWGEKHINELGYATFSFQVIFGMTFPSEGFGYLVFLSKTEGFSLDDDAY